MKGLCEPHYLGAQRSHAGTAAYPHHLGFGIHYGMEVTIRTRHHHLVAGFESEYVARRYAGHHILESRLGFRFERRCGDAYGEHYPVTLLGIVRHRVGAYRCLGIAAFQPE